MQITLNQDEINDAVENYVNSQIAVQPGQEILVDFTMGRGSNGLSATIDIKPARMGAKPKSTMRYVENDAGTDSESPEASTVETAPEQTGPTEDADVASAPTRLGKTISLRSAPSADQDGEPADAGEGTDTDEASSEEAPAPRKSIFQKQA